MIGEAGVLIVDEEIDVVLLDRRMPGMSGDEVLKRIRAQRIDCQVVMVTAVDPDLDIITMESDEYLEATVENIEALLPDPK